MRLKALLSVLLLSGLWPLSATTRNRFIVRDTSGVNALKEACEKLDCTVVGRVDGIQNQLFRVTAPSNIDPAVLLAQLLEVHGVTNAELDHAVALDTGLNQAAAIPAGLSDTRPVEYFGASVWHGYVDQPAADIVRLSTAQNAFHVAGTSIVVADIGTGVDPNHPALQGVLLPGWDFTRDLPGGWETRDLQPGFSQPPPCTDCPVAIVNQSTAAVLDQTTAGLLGGNSQYAAFGHGTMVMGIIHLVAPQAEILPLKAFHADGTGFVSDILSAIYFAVRNQAKVINMSFDLDANSPELSRALAFARRHNVICTASSGNGGQMEIVYPAALQSDVMGVASTNDLDQRSTFSNFGDAVVWVAAPGEGVISTYPFGSYGAAWGTSFSAPFVAGAAALLLNQRPGTNQSQAAAAIAHAVPIGPNMGNGRLDLVRALAANATLGPDFYLSESDHRSAEVQRGENGTFTFTFTVVPLQGFAGMVDVSVTGLPSKASVDIDPPEIPGSGEFAFTLRVDEDTPPGPYLLTITGKSGSLLHSVAIDLQVQ